MRTLAVLLAGVAAALGMAGAHACGVCIDDKVAAAYDHAVVNRAVDRGQVVVFAEVRGAGTAADFVAAARRAAVRVPGIVAGTIRTAEAPATLSFALDVRVRSPAAALAAVEKGAPAAGVKLALLKVLP
jgi:hypothetical protein